MNIYFKKRMCCAYTHNTAKAIWFGRGNKFVAKRANYRSWAEIQRVISMARVCIGYDPASSVGNLKLGRRRFCCYIIKPEDYYKI